MNMELGTIEIYNSHIHGNHKLDGSFLVFETFDLDDFYNDDYKETCDFLNENYKSMYRQGMLGYNKHSVIRNYNNLINSEDTHNIRLIQSYYTEDDEQIALDKTYLLKQIQRKWKNIYNERQKVIRMRSNPQEINYKRATGKWSKRCAKLPGLK
jgi:predicted transcriptional regulator